MAEEKKVKSWRRCIGEELFAWGGALVDETAFLVAGKQGTQMKNEITTFIVQKK